MFCFILILFFFFLFLYSSSVTEFLIWQDKPRCAYRFGSFTPTPTRGSPPTLTASGMHFPVSLVHLLDGRARGGSPGWRSSTPRESSGHPTGHPSCALVQLGDDGVANLLQLLLLVLKLLLLGRLQEERRVQVLLLALADTPQQRTSTTPIMHSKHLGWFSPTKPDLL